MGFFSWLFGRKEKAAPVQQYTPQAVSGTRISYDPKLIQGLLADHKNLFEIFGKIVSDHKAGNYTKVGDHMEQFKRALQTHLIQENVKLYVYLEHALEKDTGTVRFEDNGFVVVADLPKRVKWDQQRLKEVVELIRSGWGEDPADYVKIKFEVSERAYEAWPARLKELFAGARTVETGRPSYDLLPPDHGRRA